MRNLPILIVLMLLISGCGTVADPSPTPTPDATSTPEATPPMVGNVKHGIEIFNHGTNGAPPCSTCHRTTEGGFGFSLGPNLSGIAQRAGTRVQNMAAEYYMRQSILDPHSFVVPGFRDIMYPDFSKHLSEQDITDLIAYLMML